MIQDNMENMMTYDQYIKDEVDKYKFYTSQEFINEQLQIIERAKQTILQQSRYINVTITIEPFNYECKRDEYNRLVDEYNGYEDIIQKCINTIQKYKQKQQTHPLHKNQIPIIDDIVDEKQLIIEPEPVVEPIVEEKLEIIERTIDINDDEFDNISQVSSIDDGNDSLRSQSSSYFKQTITDDIKNDPLLLMDVLLNSPSYELIRDQSIISPENITTKDTGILSRLKHNDYDVIQTFQHIMNDYRNQKIKSPAHCRNMIGKLNQCVLNILKYNGDTKQMYKYWYIHFNKLCEVYQKQKTDEECKDVPENLDEIISKNLIGYVKELLDINQKQISFSKYQEIWDVFTKLKKDQYSLPLYLSMFMFYGRVRPNAIQVLYFNPLSTENGVSLDIDNEWVFHHNVDKNVNDTNSTIEKIDHPIITQLLDHILLQKEQQGDTSRLIYSFKLSNGNRDNNFNARVFKPAMKILGDENECIKSYNTLRKLACTKDFKDILKNANRRKHNLSTIQQCYLSTFGNKID